jgi:hypothetical protein
MVMVMVMVMVMMSNKRKPLSMPPSQDQAHTIIGNFADITVSNSGNHLHVVRVTSVILDGRMPDIPELEILRNLSV